MKLSAKSRYALEAMVYLAACAPQQNVCIRQVATGTGITESYLEQIFFRLRKAGLLTAVRGAGEAFIRGGRRKRYQPVTSSGQWRTKFLPWDVCMIRQAVKINGRSAVRPEGCGSN